MFARANNLPPEAIRYLASGVSDAPGAAQLQFTDAQEQASALQGWNQDYLQLSAGAFHGKLSQVQGTGIRLFIEQVQQSVLQTGVLDSNVLALGIPLHASGTSVFCGTPCSSDALHLFSGSSGFEFRPSRLHTMLGIELRLEQVALGAAGTEGAHRQDLVLPPQSGVLGLAPAALAQLQTYLLNLFRSARTHPHLLSNPAIVAAVADFLLEHMAPYMPAMAPPGRRNGHWSLVRRAIALVHARPEYPPTVAQLCLDLGVSRRTVQSGFRQLLGIGPLAYLKAVRLHQARQALKQAGSVTEAATSCGFWHFGHFAQDYQVLFGEKPSETLRRHNGK